MKKQIIVLLGSIGIMVVFLFFLCGKKHVDKNEITNAKHPKKYIYLSFDDGPLNGSSNINDVVLAEKIKISVMLVGKHAETRHRDVAQYKENEFIEVGNHSYSHANGHYALYYSNPPAVLEDFVRNMKLLNLNNKIARLPGRNMWRVKGRSRNDVSSGVEAADIMAQKGFTLFGWDLEWTHDPHTAEPIGTAEDIFAEIEKLIKENKTFTTSHLVVLCHDEMFQTKFEESELKRLTELLKNKKDYELRHLEDYP